MKLLSKKVIIASIIMILILNISSFSNMNNKTGIQVSSLTTNSLAFAVVDTGQTTCYSNLNTISYPLANESFGGQDANYMGNQPHYEDNGDGTITDLVTGLMWQKTPGDKKTYANIVADAEDFELAGYDDWRLPSIKELYSLILFSGEDPSGYEGSDTSNLVPFINTDYFDFEYGDTSVGERIIDSQYASSTTYVADNGLEDELVFGVNFADGRIKGYGTGPMPGQSEGKLFFVIHVRNNTDYGINDFIDNGDGTITDAATSLMWAQNDSGVGMDWEEALDWVQEINDANHLGYNDWRLPNVKELQTIVDYTRSPDTTDSAAINPLFNCTVITNEDGEKDYPFYWSGTTHASSNGMGGFACYVAFGRALGYMNSEWIDVHGAGCQRSDPKVGDASDYPYGHGPQGDAIRIDNYIRLVRNGIAEEAHSEEDYPIFTNTQSSGYFHFYIELSLIGATILFVILRKRK